MRWRRQVFFGVHTRRITRREINLNFFLRFFFKRRKCNFFTNYSDCKWHFIFKTYTFFCIVKKNNFYFVCWLIFGSKNGLIYKQKNIIIPCTWMYVRIQFMEWKINIRAYVKYNIVDAREMSNQQNDCVNFRCFFCLLFVSVPGFS